MLPQNWDRTGTATRGSYHGPMVSAPGRLHQSHVLRCESAIAAIAWA